MNSQLKSNHRPKKVTKKSVALKKLIKKATLRNLKLFFHLWITNSKLKLKRQKNISKNYKDNFLNNVDENHYKNDIKKFSSNPNVTFNPKINSLEPSENVIFSPIKDDNKIPRIKSKKYVIEWGTGSIKRTMCKDYFKLKTKTKSEEESQYSNSNELQALSNDSIKKIKPKIKSMNNLNISNNSHSVKILKKLAESKYYLTQQESENNNIYNLNEIIQNKEKNKNKKNKNKKSEKLYKNWARNQERKRILTKLINKQNKKYLYYYFYKWFKKIKKYILNKNRIIIYKDEDNDSLSNSNTNNNNPKNNKNEYYDEKDLNNIRNKSKNLTSSFKKHKKSKTVKEGIRNLFKSPDIPEKIISKINIEINNEINNNNPINIIEVSKSNDIKHKKRGKKLFKKVKTKESFNTIDNSNDNEVLLKKIFDTEGNNSSKFKNKSLIKVTNLNLGDSYLKQRLINYSKEEINPDVADIQIRQEDDTESDKKRYIAKKYKLALHLLRKVIRSFQKKFNTLGNKEKIKYYLFKWKYIISFKNIKNKKNKKYVNYNFSYEDNGGNNYNKENKMIYDNDEEDKENYKEENENIFKNDISLYRGINLYKKTFMKEKSKSGNFLSSSYDAKKLLYKSQARDYIMNSLNNFKFNSNYNLQEPLNLSISNSKNDLKDFVKQDINEFNRSSNYRKYSKKYNNGKENNLRYSYDNRINYKKKKKIKKDEVAIKNKLFLLIQKVINKQLKALKKKYFLKLYDLTFNCPSYIPYQHKKKSKKNKSTEKNIEQNKLPSLNLNFNDNNKYKKLNNTITEEERNQTSGTMRMKKLNIPIKPESEEEDFEFHYEDTGKEKKVEEIKINGISYLNEENNENKNNKAYNHNKKLNNDNGNKKKKNKIPKNNNTKKSQNKLNGKDNLQEEYIIDKNSKRVKIPELFDEIKKSMIINSNIYKMITNTREGDKEKFNINLYLKFIKQKNKALGAYQLYYLYLMLNEDNEFNMKKYFLNKWKKKCKIFNNVEKTMLWDKHKKNCICHNEWNKFSECNCHELNTALKKILIRHIYMKKINKRRYYLFLWYKKCFGRARSIYFIKDK